MPSLNSTLFFFYCTLHGNLHIKHQASNIKHQSDLIPNNTVNLSVHCTVSLAVIRGKSGLHIIFLETYPPSLLFNVPHNFLHKQTDRSDLIPEEQFLLASSTFATQDSTVQYTVHYTVYYRVHYLLHCTLNCIAHCTCFKMR